MMHEWFYQITHSSLFPRTMELTTLLSENHFGYGEVDG